MYRMVLLTLNSRPREGLSSIVAEIRMQVNYPLGISSR